MAKLTLNDFNNYYHKGGSHVEYIVVFHDADEPIKLWTGNYNSFKSVVKAFGDAIVDDIESVIYYGSSHKDVLIAYPRMALNITILGRSDETLLDIIDANESVRKLIREY